MSYMPTSVYARFLNDEYHIRLQQYGKVYIVRWSNNKDYPVNEYIGDEKLLALKMAGIKVQIIDDKGEYLESINY